MNSHQRMIALAALLPLFAPVYDVRAQDLSCASIITDGLREVAIETSSSAYLNTVFDRYCESSGSARESGLNAGIDAVVEAIPVRFTLGTSDKKQSMRNFCKEYQATATGRSDVFRRSERVVARAYDSYDTCIGLLAQGIRIAHRIRSLEKVDFFIAPAVRRPVTVNGVETSANIECFGKESTGTRSEAQRLTLDSRIVLEDGPLNIVCTRKSRVVDTESVYDEGTVTLLTDVSPYGNYGVLLPRDSRLPEDRASEIAQVLDGQRKAIESLQQSLSIIASPVAMAPEQAYSASRGGGMNPMLMDSTCPPNHVVVGVEIVVGGTCRGFCEADGGTLHKFRVKCSPRSNLATP